jgi:hypothetical protein
MQWYYSKNGVQLGPVAESDLRAKLSVGEVSATDMVWKDGMKDWLPASTTPEFAAVSPLAGAAVNPYHAPTTQPQHPAGYPGYAPPAATSGLAIASLVCGILGIVSCLYLSFLGIPAVICGHLSLSKIKNSTTPIDGRGLAIAGLVMGYICSVFFIIMAVVVIFIFATGAFGEMRSQM